MYQCPECGDWVDLAEVAAVDMTTPGQNATVRGTCTCGAGLRVSLEIVREPQPVGK